METYPPPTRISLHRADEMATRLQRQGLRYVESDDGESGRDLTVRMTGSNVLINVASDGTISYSGLRIGKSDEDSIRGHMPDGEEWVHVERIAAWIRRYHP